MMDVVQNAHSFEKEIERLVTLRNTMLNEEDMAEIDTFSESLQFLQDRIKALSTGHRNLRNTLRKQPDEYQEYVYQLDKTICRWNDVVNEVNRLTWDRTMDDFHARLMVEVDKMIARRNELMMKHCPEISTDSRRNNDNQ